MLQALARKARGFLLGTSFRRPIEDILTDCVFGGLRYFVPAEAYRPLSWLLPDLPRGGKLRKPVQLWPRYPVDNSGRFVEPDALIEIEHDDGQVLLLVEAKWNSPVYREQLEQQARAYALAARIPPSRVQHLLLVSRVQDVLEEALGHQPSPWIRTWHDVSRVLTSGKIGCSPEMRLWTEDVVRVLAAIGEKAFDGAWPDIEIGPPGQPVFWCRNAQP